MSTNAKHNSLNQEAVDPGFAEADFSREVTVTCLGNAGLVKSFKTRAGMNLWAMIRKMGIPIGAACSGVGVCGACHVRVTPSLAVTSQSEFEAESLLKNGKNPHEERLACLCRIKASLEVRADYW